MTLMFEKSSFGFGFLISTSTWFLLHVHRKLNWDSVHAPSQARKFPTLSQIAYSRMNRPDIPRHKTKISDSFAWRRTTACLEQLSKFISAHNRCRINRSFTSISLRAIGLYTTYDAKRTTEPTHHASRENNGNLTTWIGWAGICNDHWHAGALYRRTGKSWCFYSCSFIVYDIGKLETGIGFCEKVCWKRATGWFISVWEDGGE